MATQYGLRDRDTQYVLWFRNLAEIRPYLAAVGDPQVLEPVMREVTLGVAEPADTTFYFDRGKAA